MPTRECPKMGRAGMGAVWRPYNVRTIPNNTTRKPNATISVPNGVPKAARRMPARECSKMDTEWCHKGTQNHQNDAKRVPKTMKRISKGSNVPRWTPSDATREPKTTKKMPKGHSKRGRRCQKGAHNGPEGYHTGFLNGPKNTPPDNLHKTMQKDSPGTGFRAPCLT